MNVFIDNKNFTKITNKTTDFDKIDNLKAKCAVSSKQELIQLLTIAPRSWSIKRVATEFQVSEYIVRKARALCLTDGILTNPQAKKCHKLSKETEDRKSVV